MLNGLDLFSGIGGISLALKPWVRTVAYCEIDPYAQGVLLSRMQSGDIDKAPICDDVRDLKQEMFASVDIISGGFPCQDISTAGAGVGLEGSRSGLFFEIIRLASELRPRFIFLENVPALAVRGLDRVLLELTALGYDCRWTIVSAAEMGAPHLRERIWILAHTNGELVRKQSEFRPERESQAITGNDGTKESLAHSVREGLEGQRQVSERISTEQFRSVSSGWWATEPDMGRVANWVPKRVDRLRGLGNSVVPQAAREAFMRLVGLK